MSDISDDRDGRDDTEHAPESSTTALASGKRREESAGLGKKGRRLLRALGLLLALGVPAAGLLGEARGFTVTCEAERKGCEVIEHRLFEDVTTFVKFSSLHPEQGFASVTTGQVESYEGSGKYEPTGEWIFGFTLVNGNFIRASVPLGGAPGQVKAMRKMARTGEGAPIRLESWSSSAEFLWLAFVFLLGLIIATVAGWRSMVTFEPATGVILVEDRRFPLPRRTRYRGEVADIRGVTFRSDKERFYVTVERTSGEPVELGAFLTQGTATKVTAAMRRFMREAYPRG
jgi:hypothetical protein